jgi:hypothetical protein
LELHGFTNSHRRIFVVDMDVFIILSRRIFLLLPPFFAVVGFQDVLDSFMSVYESCWVIEILFLLYWIGTWMMDMDMEVV